MSNFGIEEVVSPSDDLLLSDYPLLLIRGVIASGAGDLKRGQILAEQTADGKQVPYDPGGSGGAEIAKNILWEGSDATSADAVCSMAVSGHFRASALIGYDAAAKADLRAAGIYVE